MENTRLFLAHSLQTNPADLELNNNDKIVGKIKADNSYNKIKEIVIREIKKGNMEGAVNVEGIVVFEIGDLFGALHGLKTLGFTANKIAENEFEVEIVLCDVYDFERKNSLNAFTKRGIYEFEDIRKDLFFSYLNNLADKGEDYDVVKNFNIRIKINDSIRIF